MAARYGLEQAQAGQDLQQQPHRHHNLKTGRGKEVGIDVRESIILEGTLFAATGNQPESECEGHKKPELPNK